MAKETRKTLLLLSASNFIFYNYEPQNIIHVIKVFCVQDKIE